MKTIVLDDDPTGTQSATNVRVLLESDADLIEAALREADSVYVQTNSRALYADAAVALVRRIREDGLEAGRRLGSEVRFVLRGDSTLRGHVFAETEQFMAADAVMLFVPAFPAGGRTTLDGVHRVQIDGADVPAHESEYAADPVFPFSTANLVDYVAEKSWRPGVHVPLEAVRAGRLAHVLSNAESGSVILPDALTDADIDVIAAATDAAAAAGRNVVVRSASPLAAALAGAQSEGLLEAPIVDATAATLLVCGSHTAGATRQLARVIAAWGEPAFVSTEHALQDPAVAGETAGAEAIRQFETGPLALLATERARRADHHTLDHGEKVMSALTTAVRALLPHVDIVVSKGGITSSEVAATGIGAKSAIVLGQVLPGVSVWRMPAHDGRELLYVVVPGNVGGPDTLERVLEALRLPAATRSAPPEAPMPATRFAG